MRVGETPGYYVLHLKNLKHTDFSSMLKEMHHSELFKFFRLIREIDRSWYSQAKDGTSIREDVKLIAWLGMENSTAITGTLHNKRSWTESRARWYFDKRNDTIDSGKRPEIQTKRSNSVDLPDVMVVDTRIKPRPINISGLRNCRCTFPKKR